jgi:hypothetical protein
MTMNRLAEEDCAKTREDLAGQAFVALLLWSYRYMPQKSGQSL